MFQSLFTNNLIAIRVEGTYIFIGDLLLKCEALTFGSENSVKLNKRAQKGKKEAISMVIFLIGTKYYCRHRTLSSAITLGNYTVQLQAFVDEYNG